ncbi:MAG TPA: DUF202 domain-containing protein [Pirellulales bacterium]|jgi:putative membrane protein
MPGDKPPLTGYGDPRTQLAAERTLLAWVRTGLALMGFGFVVARFGLFLRELATVHIEPVNGQPLVEVPADKLPAANQFGLSLWTGVTLILLGVAVSLLAALRHWKTVERLNRDEPLRFRPLSLGVLLAVALGTIGVALAIYLTVGLGRGP